MQKTNAMRRLDSARIPYEVLTYPVDENDLSGTHAADLLGIPYEQIFKTLLCHGDKCGYRVFCLPVAEELDLKKCAQIAGDKRVEMIPVKDLLPLTGYLRGGCSPIGMKKSFPTVIHESALLFDKFYVSGGARGVQIGLSPQALADFISASFADFLK